MFPVKASNPLLHNLIFQELKEESLLKTSLFFSFHNVFYTETNPIFLTLYSVDYCFDMVKEEDCKLWLSSIRLNSLPNEKFLDQSNFKVFSDNILNVVQIRNCF